MILWMLAIWSLVPPPHVQLPARVAGPSFDSSFLFFFLFSTLLWGNFSCLFRCLKSSANVQPVFSENCSICRCIPDVLVRRDKFCILQFHYLDFPRSPTQGLLSFTELDSQKTKFLEFFLTISSPCFSVPSFWSFLFVWLSGWVCVCVCFCFVRLFFIEGQRNRGQSLVKSWFPGLIFLSPLSSYLHLFVLFSFLDDSPQPFCHNSFSWNFNLCYHVFNLKEFLRKCSLFSEYSFLIASWSCFMYIVSTIISELIIYGFLSFVFLKASFLWVAFSICFSLCKRRPVP